VKVEEEKKARAAELEDKKRIRLEAEKRRKEREEKIAIAAKEAAKAKVNSYQVNNRSKLTIFQAEEEASKKRKFAPMLNKSGTINPNPIKRVAPLLPTGQRSSTNSLNASQGLLKAKEQLRSIKPMHPLESSILPPSTTTNAKLGPSTFRTVETSQTTSSTITLVQQPPQPRPLGPPSRPSQMASGSVHHQAITAPVKPLHILQQNRVALQSQLEEKALEMQSEDIDLPDIASE